MIDPDQLFRRLCESGLDINVRQIGIILACTAPKKKGPESLEVSHIAAHLGVYKSAITKNSDRLVELELVERVRIDSDGRRRKIEPTDKGRQLGNAIRDGLLTPVPWLANVSQAAA